MPFSYNQLPSNSCCLGRPTWWPSCHELTQTSNFTLLPSMQRLQSSLRKCASLPPPQHPPSGPADTGNNALGSTSNAHSSGHFQLGSAEVPKHRPSTSANELRAPDLGLSILAHASWWESRSRPNPPAETSACSPRTGPAGQHSNVSHGQIPQPPLRRLPPTC